MYETILYPTDGSTGADAALETVRDLAKTYDAAVHVLFVADTDHEAFGLGSDPKEHSPGMTGNPEGGGGGMVGTRIDTGELHSQVRAHGETIVEAAASHFDDIETHAAVRGGEPYQVILDYADENDIDVIVMGTHGRTGLERYLIGSVTEKVVRLSNVPVLTVREGARS